MKVSDLDRFALWHNLPKPVLLTNSQDIRDVEECLGVSLGVLPGTYGLLLVCVSNVDYLGVWGSESAVPRNSHRLDLVYENWPRFSGIWSFDVWKCNACSSCFTQAYISDPSQPSRPSCPVCNGDNTHFRYPIDLRQVIAAEVLGGEPQDYDDPDTKDIWVLGNVAVMTEKEYYAALQAYYGRNIQKRVARLDPDIATWVDVDGWCDHLVANSDGKEWGPVCQYVDGDQDTWYVWRIE